MKEPLTEKQELVYTAIVAYMNEHKMCPTYKELAQITGLPSHNNVYQIVNYLVEKGYVTREKKHRRHGRTLHVVTE